MIREFYRFPTPHPETGATALRLVQIRQFAAGPPIVEFYVGQLVDEEGEEVWVQSRVQAAIGVQEASPADLDDYALYLTEWEAAVETDDHLEQRHVSGLLAYLDLQERGLRPSPEPSAP